MKNAIIKKGKCFVCLFCMGGLAYNLIEIFWRGYSHWSMFFVGGTCFHMMGNIGKRLNKYGRFVTGTLCAGAVTAVEYISGCVVNLRWKLNVWDYSHLPGNVNGQVCLLYSVLWGILSLIAMPLFRVLEEHVIHRFSYSSR